MRTLIICTVPLNRVMETKRARWVDYVERKEEMGNTYKMLVGNLKKGNYL
jgi:hypothetical protein